MMMLPLVRALTPHLEKECAGLESGNAPILEKVTPVTADLLRWWFQQDCCDTRGVNFHAGQRQAILHAIYAREILQSATLVDLHQKLAAEDLLTARRLEEVTQSRHPNYCLLDENLFYEFRDKGVTLEEILQFARVRAKAAVSDTLL